MSQVAAELMDMAAQLPSKLVQLAINQGGCFTADQALAHGVRRRVLRDLVTRQLLVQRHSSVFGLIGQTSWEHLVWAAVLRRPDGVVSHETAGRAQGLPAMPAIVVSLTVPRGSHSSTCRGVTLHQSAPLPESHLTRFGPWVMTNVARTLFDLSADFHPSRLGYVLDDAIASRSTSLAQVGRVLTEASTRGRKGGPALAKQLDARTGKPVGRTKLERMLDEVIATLALPPARCEYPLPTDGCMTGFVDRAFPDGQLIIEADGRHWHSRVADLARDRARDRRAAAKGWQTIRVLHEELATDPYGVAADLRDVYQRRIAQLRASS